jgi:hypothetical protein
VVILKLLVLKLLWNLIVKLVEELTLRLERLRNDKMLERKALEAENLNKSLGYRPMNPGSIFTI